MFKVKSYNNIWRAEKLDIKNNTIRNTKDWDIQRWKSFLNSLYIEVTNAHTFEKFIRRIRHRCIYEGIAIVTWEEELKARKEEE